MRLRALAVGLSSLVRSSAGIITFGGAARGRGAGRLKAGDRRLRAEWLEDRRMLAVGDASSVFASLSYDGRYAAFESNATNLVAGDTNGRLDVFVKEYYSGAIARVSVDNAGVQGNGDSYGAVISGNGRYVAYQSAATNLVAGDTNGVGDIFVRDLILGTTRRVSTTSGGAQVNGASFNASLSHDGRYIAFASSASNLVSGDTNGVTDVFVKDLVSGLVTRVSVDANGVQANFDSDNPSLAGDGRHVAFESNATNLVSGDTNGSRDIFLRRLQDGAVVRVSIDSAGVQGNLHSYNPSLSGDARYIAFESDSSNIAAGDANSSADIFLRDMLNGTTTRISTTAGGVEGNAGSFHPTISYDGSGVAFYSAATNLVGNDTNAAHDVFYKNLGTGGVTRLSTSSADAQSDKGSFIASAAISGDGRYVAFDSLGTTLSASDTNQVSDVYLKDRTSGATTLLSQSGTAVRRDEAIIDFGGSGLYAWKDDAAWQKLHSYNVVSTTPVDLDGNGQSDLVVDFGSGIGLYIYYNNSNWVPLHSYTARSVAGGYFQYGTPQGQLIVDFGPGVGLYEYYASTNSWRILSSLSPQSMVVGDTDGNGQQDVVCDLGTAGIYVWKNDAAWFKLHDYNPNAMVTGDLNGNGQTDVMVDFGTGFGLWVYMDNSNWQKLHAYATASLAAGDLSGDGWDELIVDFGTGFGVWEYYPNLGTWKMLTGVRADSMVTGDLDGNGKRELIADLGVNGLYIYRNDTSWMHYNSWNPEAVAAADLNAPARFRSSAAGSTPQAATASAAAATDRALSALLAQESARATAASTTGSLGQDESNKEGLLKV